MAATIATSASGRMRRIVSRSQTITATRRMLAPALADCVHAMLIRTGTHLAT